MKERLGAIITGYSKDGMSITARDIKANGAMTLLLKEALKPNLVQTIEGVPAFVHGGPFANIAHGCNSIVSTKLALKASDYVITEAGFGADLGAEKFFNIKCRQAGLTPDLIIVTLTCRALKRQGGVAKEDLSKNSVISLKKGLPNLERHINSLSNFGVPILVTINTRQEDSIAEVSEVIKFCKDLGVSAVPCDIWGKGGKGGLELAKLALSTLKKASKFRFLYQNSDPIRLKIEKIAKVIYGADDVDFSHDAISQISDIEKGPYSKLPICMAKTQFSLTDNPELLGAPKGFNIHVKRLKVSAGAGFIVAYTGDVMTMPGLPSHPAAENIDISASGEITGLF
jgi:formate--tetrahydrofolate ligase